MRAKKKCLDRTSCAKSVFVDLSTFIDFSFNYNASNEVGTLFLLLLEITSTAAVALSASHL